MCEIAHVDGIRRFGLVAQHHRCTPILGVGQLVIDSDYDTAEFALLVRSDLKRRGLGSALLERVTHYARRIALRRLTADVLRENDAMLGLAERLRFQVSASPADRSMLHLSLMLNPTQAVQPRWMS
jgi:acetyltransferase